MADRPKRVRRQEAVRVGYLNDFNPLALGEGKSAADMAHMRCGRRNILFLMLRMFCLRLSAFSRVN